MVLNTEAWIGSIGYHCNTLAVVSNEIYEVYGNDVNCNSLAIDLDTRVTTIFDPYPVFLPFFISVFFA